MEYHMIVEHVLESGSGKINEDSLFIDQNIFGVFDGATSLNTETYDGGKTGGWIASATARSVFSKNHYPLNILARTANTEISKQMKANGVDRSKKENLWSTSAAVIRITNDRLEWIQTGDAAIILIYKDHSFKSLGQYADHDHQTLSMWKDYVRKDAALAREKGVHNILKGQIIKTRAGMNSKYGVLNGEKAACSFLQKGFESLENVKEILLFTDGLSIPSSTPRKKKEFSALVESYQHVGLKKLCERIRQMEKQDPDCLIYPRFKCHDDIAAIAIKEL